MQFNLVVNAFEAIGETPVAEGGDAYVHFPLPVIAEGQGG
jgi:hypothetical protein